MRSINDSAPVQCNKKILINADSKTVWAVLTDIDNWATWQTDISQSKLHGELKPETAFDWKSGSAKIRSVIHTVNASSQFGWTGKSFGMLAIHNWTLTEADNKTTLEVNESMEGFLAALFKKPFNKNLEQGMQKWLELLKRECEQLSCSACNSKSFEK